MDANFRTMQVKIPLIIKSLKSSSCNLVLEVMPDEVKKIAYILIIIFIYEYLKKIYIHIYSKFFMNSK